MPSLNKLVQGLEVLLGDLIMRKGGAGFREALVGIEGADIGQWSVPGSWLLWGMWSYHWSVVGPRLHVGYLHHLARSPNRIGT